jgi:hypothetical protein
MLDRLISTHPYPKGEGKLLALLAITILGDTYHIDSLFYPRVSVKKIKFSNMGCRADYPTTIASPPGESGNTDNEDDDDAGQETKTKDAKEAAIGGAHCGGSLHN